MDVGERVTSWENSDDLESSSSGVWITGDVEHIGNWQYLVGTHAPPTFCLYFKESGEYKYYLIVQRNSSERVVGLTAEEGKKTHQCLIYNPGLTEHRTDRAYHIRTQ